MKKFPYYRQLDAMERNASPVRPHVLACGVNKIHL